MDNGLDVASFDVTLDNFGRCAVCGRRDGCCGRCHRAHDYAWGNPTISIQRDGVDRLGPARQAPRPRPGNPVVDNRTTVR